MRRLRYDTTKRGLRGTAVQRERTDALTIDYRYKYISSMHGAVWWAPFSQCVERSEKLSSSLQARDSPQTPYGE